VVPNYQRSINCC